MALPKGRTNNPAGRPPKGRALAERITTALNKTADYGSGKKKNIVILADIVVSALITGEVDLPNGLRVALEPKEWIDLFKFISTHIDGPVKSKVEISGDQDAPLIVKGYVTISPDDWDNIQSSAVADRAVARQVTGDTIDG